MPATSHLDVTHADISLVGDVHVVGDYLTLVGEVVLVGVIQCSHLAVSTCITDHINGIERGSCMLHFAALPLSRLKYVLPLAQGYVLRSLPAQHTE